MVRVPDSTPAGRVIPFHTKFFHGLYSDKNLLFGIVTANASGTQQPWEGCSGKRLGLVAGRTRLWELNMKRTRSILAVGSITVIALAIGITILLFLQSAMMPRNWKSLRSGVSRMEAHKIMEVGKRSFLYESHDGQETWRVPEIVGEWNLIFYYHNDEATLIYISYKNPYCYLFDRMQNR